MTSFRKAIDRILRGDSDANIDFHELCIVLKEMGFDERIRGATTSLQAMEYRRF